MTTRIGRIETTRIGRIETTRPRKRTYRSAAVGPDRGINQREQPAVGQVPDYVRRLEPTMARWAHWRRPDGQWEPRPRVTGRWELGGAIRAHSATWRQAVITERIGRNRNRGATGGPTRTERNRVPPGWGKRRHETASARARKAEPADRLGRCGIGPARKEANRIRAAAGRPRRSDHLNRRNFGKRRGPSRGGRIIGRLETGHRASSPTSEQLLVR